MSCDFIGVTNPVIGSDRITFKHCLLLSYCSLLQTLVQYWVPATCSVEFSEESAAKTVEKIL